jgi:hypothetical protein
MTSKDPRLIARIVGEKKGGSGAAPVLIVTKPFRGDFNCVRAS